MIIATNRSLCVTQIELFSPSFYPEKGIFVIFTFIVEDMELFADFYY